MSPGATQRKYSIATIGADGIGPEVIDAGVQVLRKLASLDGTFSLDFKEYDWSSETYKKTGKYIPDGGLDELKKHDAILFGAVGAPGEYISPSLFFQYLPAMPLSTIFFQTLRINVSTLSSYPVFTHNVNFLP